MKKKVDKAVKKETKAGGNEVREEMEEGKKHVKGGEYEEGKNGRDESERTRKLIIKEYI